LQERNALIVGLFLFPAAEGSNLDFHTSGFASGWEN
jgi:hypothetical protein